MPKNTTKISKKNSNRKTFKAVEKKIEEDNIIDKIAKNIFTDNFETTLNRFKDFYEERKDSEQDKPDICFYFLFFLSVFFTEYQTFSPQSLKTISDLISNLSNYLNSKSTKAAGETPIDGVLAFGNHHLIKEIIPYIKEKQIIIKLNYLIVQRSSKGLEEITNAINQNRLDINTNISKTVDFNILIYLCTTDNTDTMYLQEDYKDNLRMIEAILELKQAISTIKNQKTDYPQEIFQYFKSSKQSDLMLKEVLEHSYSILLEALISNRSINIDTIKTKHYYSIANSPVAKLEKQIATINTLKANGLKFDEGYLLKHTCFLGNFNRLHYHFRSSENLQNYYSEIKECETLSREYVKFLQQQLNKAIDVTLSIKTNKIVVFYNVGKRIQAAFPIDTEILVRVLKSEDLEVCKKASIAILKDMRLEDKTLFLSEIQALKRGHNIQETTTIIQEILEEGDSSNTKKDELKDTKSQDKQQGQENKNITLLKKAVQENNYKQVQLISNQIANIPKSIIEKKYEPYICNTTKSLVIKLLGDAFVQTKNNKGEKLETLRELKKLFPTPFLNQQDYNKTIIYHALNNKGQDILPAFIATLDHRSVHACFDSNHDFVDWYSTYLFKKCKTHLTDSNVALLQSTFYSGNQISLNLKCKLPFSWVLMYKNTCVDSNQKYSGDYNYAYDRRSVNLSRVRENNAFGHNIFVDLKISLIFMNIPKEDLCKEDILPTKREKYVLNSEIASILSSKFKDTQESTHTNYTTHLLYKLFGNNLEKAVNDINSLIEPSTKITPQAIQELDKAKIQSIYSC